MSNRRQRTRRKRLLKGSQVDALLALLVLVRRRIRAKGPKAGMYWTIDALRAEGFSSVALQWLVETGCLTLARPRIGKSQAGARHQPHGSQNGKQRFMVRCTRKLRSMLRVIHEMAIDHRAAAGGNDNGAAPDILPRYDAAARELWLGPVLVKRLTGQAYNQARALTEFEKAGWRRCIAESMENESPIDPVQRLHDTVRRLNEAQSHALIRFERDGTGHGIRWGLTRPTSAAGGANGFGGQTTGPFS